MSVYEKSNLDGRVISLFITLSYLHSLFYLFFFSLSHLFILSCQNHYFTELYVAGICGLSFMGEEGLLEINPALNITKRAEKHLKVIQDGWKK